MLNKATVKKILPGVLAFVLIVAIGFPTVQAQSVPALSLGSVYDAQQGTVLEIPVTISDMPSLAMIQFCLRYDSEKLTYSDFLEGELLAGQEEPTFNSKNAGKLYFVWDSTEPLSGSGKIGTFIFQIKDSAVGSTDVCIDPDEEIVFADDTYNNFTPAFISGKIAIFDFCLPVDLTVIAREAFAGSDARFVRLSENLESIGPRAFADCSNLSCIVIPSDAAISSTAFDGVQDLTVIGKTGSAAETIASENGFTFIALP